MNLGEIRCPAGILTHGRPTLLSLPEALVGPEMDYLIQRPELRDVVPDHRWEVPPLNRKPLGLVQPKVLGDRSGLHGIGPVLDDHVFGIPMNGVSPPPRRTMSKR